MDFSKWPVAQHYVAFCEPIYALRRLQCLQTYCPSGTTVLCPCLGIPGVPDHRVRVLRCHLLCPITRFRAWQQRTCSALSSVLFQLLVLRIPAIPSFRAIGHILPVAWYPPVKKSTERCTTASAVHQRISGMGYNWPPLRPVHRRISDGVCNNVGWLGGVRLFVYSRIREMAEIDNPAWDFSLIDSARTSMV